jgi:hypothetical protein
MSAEFKFQTEVRMVPNHRFAGLARNRKDRVGHKVDGWTILAPAPYVGRTRWYAQHSCGAKPVVLFDHNLRPERPIRCADCDPLAQRRTRK